MKQENIDAAKVNFFPPGIPLIAIVTGISMDRIWPLSTGISVPPSTPHSVSLQHPHERRRRP